jgi:hypothetical protein
LFCACDSDHKNCHWSTTQTVGGICTANIDCESGVCAAAGPGNIPTCRSPVCEKSGRACSGVENCCHGFCNAAGICDSSRSPAPFPIGGSNPVPLPSVPVLCSLAAVNPSTGTVDPCPPGYGCAPSGTNDGRNYCRPVAPCAGNPTLAPAGSPCCIAYGYLIKAGQVCCAGLAPKPAGFGDNTWKCMPSSR